MSFLKSRSTKNPIITGSGLLRAIGLLGDRDSMNLAIENLQTRDATQRANVIEAWTRSAQNTGTSCNR